MNPVFAQLNFDVPMPLVAAICVVAGAALMWLANVVKAVRANDDRFERKSSPSLPEKYVLRPEFNDFKSDVDARFKDMTDASAKSRARLYDKLEEVAKKVQGIEVADKHQTETINETSSDVKRLINHVGELRGKVNKND